MVEAVVEKNVANALDLSESEEEEEMEDLIEDFALDSLDVEDRVVIPASVVSFRY